MISDVLTIILGGGRGTRLYPLTKYRSKPAVPIGGQYRLIDIPVSNCIHSGFYRVYILTQFMSASLNRHISRAFSFDHLRRGFIEVIPAAQTDAYDDSWFQGTADAVRKSLIHFHQHNFDDYIILSGDHLYRMDYRQMLRVHRRANADLTVAAVPIEPEMAPQFGLLRIQPDGLITDFVEKPKDPATINDFIVKQKAKGRAKDVCLASMGIYIFKRALLNRLLAENDGVDFGYNIVPDAIRSHRAVVFRFDGYWQDVGLVRDFFYANIRMTDPAPRFSFYDPNHPFFTHPRHLPGSIISRTLVDNSIICDGCLITDSEIRSSVIGIRTIISSGCEIEQSLIMGADYYQGEAFYPSLVGLNIPEIGIGANCMISGAIIDKNARIGAGVVIEPKPKGTNFNGDGFAVRDGITVVEKNAIIPPGMVI